MFIKQGRLMATILKNLLNNFFHPQKDSPWKVQLLMQWEKIIGRLSSKVTLEKMYEDTLVLGVYDSCWMQELHLLSPLLIANINANLDRPRIKTLRFKLIALHKEKKPTITKAEPAVTINRMLSRTEEKALHLIEDPALREALKKYLLRCLGEKK